MHKNLLITMSGGTTSVINATLVGIIKTALASGKIDRIYGGHNGLPGVFDDDLIDLTEITTGEMEKLYYTPASGFIGTSRIKPLDSNEMIKLSEMFSRMSIRYFFNIGGNGTIKQSISIAKSISDVTVVSIAKTVDNDLGDNEFKKVYYTPGYPSCANYWRHKMLIFNQENLGAHSHDQVLIAQTFGRETGHLAACARLADPNRRMPLMILLPEDQQKAPHLISTVQKSLKLHGRLMIVMSEGYYIDDIGGRHDPSGQTMYGSSQTTQAQNLVNLLYGYGIQARAFIPGFDQRSEILFTTKSDLSHARGIGEFAVQRALEGDSRFLASISFVNNAISYTSIPFSEIGDFSRSLPKRWIRYGEYDVNDRFIDYASPLVERTLYGGI